MSLEWISCKGSCSGSDPTSDTVKINPALLAAQKENAQPAPNQPAGVQKGEEDKKKAQEEEARQKKEAERLRLEQENRRRLEEEAARKREDQLAAEREAAARAAAERAAAEKAAAEAAAEAAAAKEREEQRLRLEAERQAQEKQRQEQEAAEAQRRAQLEAAQEKVGKWCKANGYPDMNTKKKSFMSGSKFPIHEAVAKKNEDIVALLIQTGADKAAKNSKGQTAEDLARKMNKAGDMDAIIAQLSSA